MANKKQVTICWAVFKGEKYTISLSEEEVWASLPSSPYFKPSERHLWSVETSIEEVPLVIGDYKNWGTDEDPLPHVKWICPFTGAIFYTDLKSEETNPALWYCENGAGVALVSWQQEPSQ